MFRRVAQAPLGGSARRAIYAGEWRASATFSLFRDNKHTSYTSPRTAPSSGDSSAWGLFETKRSFATGDRSRDPKDVKDPDVQVMNDMRLLKHLNVTAEEVSTYLRMYSAVDSPVFGVIKVGGGVIEDNLDDLVSSISTLCKFGLIPVVVHGAGPQLNRTLKEKGIPSAYMNGLRVTNLEVLKIARSVFSDVNFRLCDALEKAGTRAIPIQTGIFDAEPLDMNTYGYVGNVTEVHIGPIQSALDHKCVPILTCMGQSDDGHFLNINADIAAKEVARSLQPRTVVYVSAKGGFVDNDGKVIQSIDINYDFEHLKSQPWFKEGDLLKLTEIKELMEVLPRKSTVTVTSAKLMAKELLTHSLTGTLISKNEKIQKFTSLDDVNTTRLQILLEKVFNAKLREGFIDELRGSLECIFLSEMYHGAAIITRVSGVPYLHKFAVAEETQMEGLGRRLFEQVKSNYPELIWRSKLNNPINQWYFKQAKGAIRTENWAVFWYGLKEQLGRLQELIDEVVAKPPDIQRFSEGPPILRVPKFTPEEEPKSQHRVFKLGLIGARGHTGLELIKLIERHPYLALSVASSRSLKHKHLKELYPETKLDITFCDLEPKEISDHTDDVDIWVLAMPNGAASQFVAHIPPEKHVIDLSADYRFDNTWQYGLPERHGYRESIRTAKRVANPGCYATGQQLSLLPLLEDAELGLKNILTGTPVIFGVSGYSGAGTTPSRKNDITELSDNLMAYTLQNHIHEREVTAQLGHLGHQDGVRFIPHVAQWFRGIHLTVAASLDGSIGREELIYRYRSYYEDEKAVEVVNDIPEVRDIMGKPHACVGGFSLAKDDTRLVITTTIDNLAKGAATQCMQNINLMLGLEEFISILDDAHPH